MLLHKFLGHAPEVFYKRREQPHHGERDEDGGAAVEKDVERGSSRSARRGETKGKEIIEDYAGHDVAHRSQHCGRKDIVVPMYFCAFHKSAYGRRDNVVQHEPHNPR